MAQDQIAKLSRAINYSGKMISFHINNKIQRIKIRRGIFYHSPFVNEKPEVFIQQVISPFGKFISSKNINVYLARQNIFNLEIKVDWENYKMILFNIM